MAPPEAHRGTMQVHTEPTCGNAPRCEILRRCAVALIVGNAVELVNLLALGIEWKIPGGAWRAFGDDPRP